MELGGYGYGAMETGRYGARELGSYGIYRLLGS